MTKEPKSNWELKNEQKMKEIELQNKQELKIELDSTAIIGISIVCMTAIIITFMILKYKKKNKAPLE